MIMLQNTGSRPYQSPRNTIPDVRNHVFGLVCWIFPWSFRVPSTLFLHQQELRRRFTGVLFEHLVESGFGTETRLESQRKNGLVLLFGIGQFPDDLFYPECIHEAIEIGIRILINQIRNVPGRHLQARRRFFQRKPRLSVQLVVAEDTMQPFELRLVVKTGKIGLFSLFLAR